MNNRQELQQKIILKAMEDVNFKKALMADAKTAIEKEFGITIPKDFDVKVVEETPASAYLVIPSVDEEKATANVIW